MCPSQCVIVDHDTRADAPYADTDETVYDGAVEDVWDGQHG
jgi:hypothetical protein